MSEMEKINQEEEKEIAGGAVTPDEIHNLKNFVTRTVGRLPAGTYLQMQVLLLPMREMQLLQKIHIPERL